MSVAGSMPFAAAADVLVPPAGLLQLPLPLRPTWQALLFAELDAGDRRQLPRFQRGPDGRVTIVYRRPSGAAPLRPEQILALLRHPPSYARERAVISSLLAQLRSLGVQVSLQPSRQPGAAGEWDPRAGVLRLRPDLPASGSEEFARVLNHEAIHVAQSCRGGGVRRPAVPLGLAVSMDAASQRLLQRPPYLGMSVASRRLEEEAFALQADLSAGSSLLTRHCGTPPAGLTAVPPQRGSVHIETPTALRPRRLAATPRPRSASRPLPRLAGWSDEQFAVHPSVLAAFFAAAARPRPAGI